MIPKIIHYCWFGGKEKPADVQTYIASWHKYCPDYDFYEWNEHTFDVTQNDYCREAMKAKKWAFVTDYVRLKVLYDYGGIYMDSDVEVLKPLDPLLMFNGLSGYESQNHVPTGTMGACPRNEWICMLLHDYDERHFVLPDGSFDQTTNVEVITRLTQERYGLKLHGQRIEFGDGNVFLPFDYLCAKDPATHIVRRTSHTYTIHHFRGSWFDADVQEQVKEWREFFYRYYQILPYRPAMYMASLHQAYCQGGVSMIVAKVQRRIGSLFNRE